MRKSKVLPFEYAVLKRLKLIHPDWLNKRLLVAFSGGRDSSALLEILLAIRTRARFEIAVAHVHHGSSSDKTVSKYRNQAAKKAQKIALENNLKLFLLKHEGAELKSEADFRSTREQLLSKCLVENNFDWLVLGHHADDLLETRMIRLIRGTGMQGLSAMHFAHQKKLRPLLDLTVQEIQHYAELKNLKWIEDPSNSSNDYLRNWIRNFWLPQLEQKRAGAVKSLSRSLEIISDSVSRVPTEQKAGLEVIKRAEFAGLSVVEKREWLARVMLEQGAKDFSRRQIDEILKRLGGSRNGIRRKMSFEVGGLKWLVNAEQIEAVRL